MSRPEADLSLFSEILQRRPELTPTLPRDLERHYLPFVEKLIGLRQQQNPDEALIVGVSAIQGAGKTTQGEVMEVLLRVSGHPMVSVSIDDHYLTHPELSALRAADPRFVRRGVTHDIELAQNTLAQLRSMRDGEPVLVPSYYKGAHKGDGDRYRWITPQSGVSLVVRVIETEMIVDRQMQLVRAIHLEEAEFNGHALPIPPNMGSDIPLVSGVVDYSLLNYLTGIAKTNQVFEISTKNKGTVQTLFFNSKDASGHSFELYSSGTALPPGWKVINGKPDFILYDGWMLGARPVKDETVFEFSGLPALERPEDIAFAKLINRRLRNYLPLWDQVTYQTVLYVRNYHKSLEWRDQAEEPLRAKGQGMTPDQIREFVHYFWRSVHPAIHIANLARNTKYTDQVTFINDDHSIGPTTTPDWPNYYIPR